MANTWFLDAGHGGTDPGASGFGYKEKDWTLEASLYIAKRLREHGIKVIESRTTDKTIDSTPRGAMIKNSGAQRGVSIHFNAFNGKARGFEFIHSIYADGKFEKMLTEEFRKLDIPERRTFTRTLPNNPKQDYYFIHRLTGSARMTIVEIGFIDNKSDNDLLNTKAKREKYYEAIIKAICKEEKITYKTKNGGNPSPKPTQPAKPSTPSTKGLYRVFENGKQTGAYKDPIKSVQNAVKKGVKEIKLERI